MSAILPIGPAPRLAGPYTASPGQTSFSFAFALINAEDLAVETAPAADPDNWTRASLGLGYTIPTALPSAAGGNVVFTSPLVGGTQVRIFGDALIANTQDPLPAGRVDSVALNRAFDRLTIWAQEARRDLESDAQGLRARLDELDELLSSSANGWTAVEAVVNRGDDRVRKIIDWTGGLGTKPTAPVYVGPGGLVPSITQAVNIRGERGLGLRALDVLADESELPETGQPGDAYLIDATIWLWSSSAGEWRSGGSFLETATLAYNQVPFCTADLATTSLPVNVTSFLTAGYYGPGDGKGGRFKEVESAPAHGAYRTDADGRIWALAEFSPSPTMLGADLTGGTDNAALFQACVNLCSANGGGDVRGWVGTLRATTPIVFPNYVGFDGPGMMACRLVGTAETDGIVVAGQYCMIAGIRVSSCARGFVGTATARFCTLREVYGYQNRIGLDWVDGYINSVISSKFMFNDFGGCIRGLSYEFNLIDCVIDNNTGGLGLLLSGSIGVNLAYCTIEGNRVLSTRQGVGLAVFGAPQRISVTGCWFEQNGTTFLADGVTLNDFGCDILLGDRLGTLGAEIVSKCLPAEYAPASDLSTSGMILVEGNFFYNSRHYIQARYQSSTLSLQVKKNRYAPSNARQTVPWSINWVSGGVPRMFDIADNLAFPNSPEVWTPGGIGGSDIHVTGTPPVDGILWNGKDVFTREMTLAEFAALSGATLACDARVPAAGVASLYRDRKLVPGTGGVRTTAGTGRCRIGAAGIFTPGQDTYFIGLSSPAGQISYVYTGGTATLGLAVAGRPHTFVVAHLATPASAEGTFFTGEYYGYAVMDAATYTASFGGRTRVRITDFDVVSVPDRAAAAPSSAAQQCTQGDVVWNTAPTGTGTPALWMCTATGTPGTWNPLNLS